MINFSQPQPMPSGQNKFGDWLSGVAKNYLIPKIFPNLFLRPDFVVGIPVAFATFFFALVTPKALFQLKERPGILKDFLAKHITYLTIFNRTTRNNT